MRLLKLNYLQQQQRSLDNEQRFNDSEEPSCRSNKLHPANIQKKSLLLLYSRAEAKMSYLRGGRWLHMLQARQTIFDCTFCCRITLHAHVSDSEWITRRLWWAQWVNMMRFAAERLNLSCQSRTISALMRLNKHTVRATQACQAPLLSWRWSKLFHLSGEEKTVTDWAMNNWGCLVSELN